MMINSQKKRKILSIVLSAVLFVGLGFYDVSAATSGGPGEHIDVIVTFDRTPSKGEHEIFRGLGGNVTHSFTIIPAVAGSLPLNAIEALERNPHVVSVELDRDVYAIEPSYATELSRTWSVEQIGADEAHIAGYFGENIKVAVLDSGVDYAHSDLESNFIAGELGRDFVESDDYPMDVYGHGTHVAGTIAAARDGLGSVGVSPEAQIIALRILDDNGVGSTSNVIAALDWIAAYNELNPYEPIRITNNSYGSGVYSAAEHLAFDNAAQSSNLGVLHIAAAGNSGNPSGKSDNVIYPAKYDSVVAVAATDNNDMRASFSSTGPDVELAAPGVSVLSTWNDSTSYLNPQPYLLDGDYYKEGSGTSMASPHVAGVAALVMAANGNYTADKVRQIMNETASDLGIAGRDIKYGYGLVDASAALGLTTIINNQPIAYDQSVTTGEDTAKNLTLTGYDIDGDALTYSIVTGPSHGLLTGTLPNVIYTPDQDYYGPDSFTFKVNDGIVDSNNATVSITITEKPSVNTVNVSIEMTTTTKPAGKNIFTWATAKVSVGEPNALIGDALVTGHWVGATSDIDSGITGIDGTVSLTSDQVKNWDGSKAFTFIVDSVNIGGFTYVPAGEPSDYILK